MAMSSILEENKTSLHADSSRASAPIKMVDSCASSAAKGFGLRAATFGLLSNGQNRSDRGGALPILRALLDSGPDADLHFHKQGKPKLVKFKKRISHVTWHASNGDFAAGYCAELNMALPDYLRSESVNFWPGAAFLDSEAEDP